MGRPITAPGPSWGPAKQTKCLAGEPRRQQDRYLGLFKRYLKMPWRKLVPAQSAGALHHRRRWSGRPTSARPIMEHRSIERDKQKQLEIEGDIKSSSVNEAPSHPTRHYASIIRDDRIPASRLSVLFDRFQVRTWMQMRPRPLFNVEQRPNWRLTGPRSRSITRAQ